jgi:parallel beta-helix repeat protein
MVKKLDGYDSILDKLNAHDSSLADLASQVVYAENYKIQTPETNDTARLQRALDTGKSVWLQYGKTYTISSAIILKADYQALFGGGKIVSTATSGNVISSTNLNNIRISDIQIQCGVSSTTKGIYLSGCNNAVIERNSISQHGDSGIYLVGSSYCEIRNNVFSNASSNASFGSSTAKDINLEYTNLNCIIESNICKSNGAYGVQIRTYANGDHNDGHIVTKNIIDGYNSYGILLYRDSQILADVPNQSVSKCIISNNYISNISGGRPSDPANPTVLIFGAGVYLQGAENCTVIGNQLYNTCLQNNDELLAPGAIGLANVGACSITGNSIKSSSRYGVYLNDANSYGDTLGSIVITGNTIESCTKSGVKSVVQNNVIISNNSITSVDFGIVTNGGSSNVTRNNYTIIGNSIRNCVSSAINLVYVSGVICEGNHIDLVGSGVHCISASNSSNITLANNRIKGASSRGIDFGSSCTGTNKIHGNNISGCATGVLVNAPATFKDNTVESNTTNLSGTYIPFNNVGDNATPDVKYRDIIQVAPTTALTYTNFLNGFTGQELIIQATNGNTTIAHNANISLKGAVNFVMPSNSVVRLLKTAGIWVEISRNV